MINGIASSTTLDALWGVPPSQGQKLQPPAPSTPPTDTVQLSSQARAAAADADGDGDGR